MELPNKFKFNHWYDPIDGGYTAVKESSQKWVVSWDGGSVDYWDTDVQRIIEEGTWVVIEETAKPHKHAELIKQWADGAEIQQIEEQAGQRDWVTVSRPRWYEDKLYRVKPKEERKLELTLSEKDANDLYHILSDSKPMLETLYLSLYKQLSAFVKGARNA